jgi:gamma-glutamyltranspeptidase/glutathione hydrolase
MVASPHPTASEAGLRVLRAGGNAVDAAVATAFALSVVAPSTAGIGGYGGCLVASLAGRAGPIAVDFTSVAPAAAREDMYGITSPQTLAVAGDANVFGGRAVDVPGVVAGLVHAHSRFGRLALTSVVEPAVEAAAEGFPVDDWLGLKVAEVLMPRAARFPDTLRLFAPDGLPPRRGEVMRNPELARVIARIGREGAEAFYRGEVAHAIVTAVRADGGCLALEDLAGYRVEEHAPVHASYRGYTVFTPGLPTGGLTVLQMLRVLDGMSPPTAGDDAALAHALVETAKVCWRERLLRYGDPRCVPVDPTVEISETLVASLRDRVVAGMAAPAPGEVIAPDPVVGTAHLCTADAAGNVVSLTLTHGGSFGSLLSVPGTGIVLGHGLSRFDPRPGRANSIAPGKRPLHNMSPLILYRDGAPALCLGGAGGRTIPNNLVHMVVRLIDLGAGLEEAMAASRVHVETAEPVAVEVGGEAVAEGLRRFGHGVTMRPPFGSLQGIALDGLGTMRGVADPRRAGTICAD